MPTSGGCSYLPKVTFVLSLNSCDGREVCTVLVATFIPRGQTEGEKSFLLPMNTNPAACVSNVSPPHTANTLHLAVTSNAECGGLLSIWANRPGLRLHLCVCSWRFVSHWLWTSKIKHLSLNLQPFPMWLRVISMTDFWTEWPGSIGMIGLGFSRHPLNLKNS